MKLLIIEDERLAFEQLVQELLSIDEVLEIPPPCTSIKQSVKWLENNQPDLILMDIHLADGLSFDIFKLCRVNCPVIFITAFDKYLSQAFEFNSIDYLLKPIHQEKLHATIKKYKSLQHHFINNHGALLEYLSNQNRKKTFVIVKKGLAFQTVRVDDTSYFYTENKLVFLVDKSNQKYIVDKNNLSELESELDNTLFYRANRKYIVNANYIKGFKQFDRRMGLELVISPKEEIIISQENIVSFKKWISDI
jgi:DNA-binding LytR/AlgR family response regulator